MIVVMHSNKGIHLMIQKILKQLHNNKGVYLIKMALLLPVILLFWGWIISRALMLNYELHQQIAVDFSALSGVHYAFYRDAYPGNESLMHTHMTERAQQVLSCFGLVVRDSPIIDTDDDHIFMTINSDSPPRSLFLIDGKIIHKTAQAQHHTTTHITTLLP